ncbi:thiamine pyrophosphate-dependent enzyme [Candidatus Pelagibacter sp.]|jgi:TPP-dependent pyruvate/acetoin dehydrogenase alpha subunit|nr:thiamine pyrophosphate-dependent enzyme [Candidatus Pelagibacter sp.]|tara:strand:- start:161 stop:754 length:594 start_codon:yes stop_codon:yes gene_type:complete
MITKKELIDFELDIKKVYESGKIKAPIHLSGNNESELIKIFKKIHKNDWVFSTWRNHYHALLKGIPQDWLKKEIIAGRSMGINSIKQKFFSSAIVAGIIPIALGVAKAMKLKNKNNTNKVWVFIGDMTFETGMFHECYKYAKNHKLPLKFVVEDNGLSTNTPTNKVWIKKSKKPKDVIYYKYKRKFPHHGTGGWVLF